jgi:NADH-quinone oxidoreductase subunit A
VAAASDFGTVGLVVLMASAVTLVTLVLAHVIGPRRHGPVKDDTYESGMTPVMDARRRFNVRFYLVAVLYLVFGVEVVFLYPWAVVFPTLRQELSAGTTGGEPTTWAVALANAGYGPGFILGAVLVFLVLLLVGLIYEWRKGVFKWD